MGLKKEIDYLCPKCGELFVYTATEFGYAMKDGSCHMCVKLEDEED